MITGSSGSSRKPSIRLRMHWTCALGRLRSPGDWARPVQACRPRARALATGTAKTLRILRLSLAADIDEPGPSPWFCVGPPGPIVHAKDLRQMGNGRPRLRLEISKHSAELLARAPGQPELGVAQGGR